MGLGTYTAEFQASNGCSQTVQLTVTDLFQTQYNHFISDFTISPSSQQLVTCQPTAIAIGSVDTWIVVDQTGAIIPTFAQGLGIQYYSVSGNNYTITFKREMADRCQTFITQKGIQRRKQMKNTSLNTFVDPTLRSYPNLTSGLVNIELTDAETTTTFIEVFNTLGQVILKKKVQEQNNIEIDLSKEISGIYLIQVENGSHKFTTKIIKK